MITEIDLPPWVVYAPWVFSGFGILMVAMGYMNYRKSIYMSTKNNEI